MASSTGFRPGDRVKATKAVDSTMYGTVGEPRSDGDVLVHWDRGGHAVVRPSRLERAESEPVPDPCSRCGGKGYIYLPMDRKGEDDTCPECGGSGQTEEGMARVEARRRAKRRRARQEADDGRRSNEADRHAYGTHPLTRRYDPDNAIR